MNLTYVGFPPHELGRKRRSLIDARIQDVGKCIRAAARELQNTKKVANARLFKDWFGRKTGKEDFEPVANKIQKLSYGYSSASVTVYYHTAIVTLGLQPNFCNRTLAAALLGQSKYSSIQRGSHKLIICPDFYDARIMGAQYAPQDTQLGSIMHEMTHMFCGTEDKGRDGTDSTAYGEANCIQNALLSVNRARNNADNYCYYLTQLYFTSAVKNPWVVHY